MTDIELRDSIAKEIFVFMLKHDAEKPVRGITTEMVAKVAFDTSDIFMNEKLSRVTNAIPNRSFIGAKE